MQSKPIVKNKYSGRIKHLMAGAIFSVVALVILFTCSKTAHASLISFVTSILGGEQASAKTDQEALTPNSQTIAILQPAVNIDPNPNKIGDTVPIDKNALVTDISASDASDANAVNTQISVYTVRPGDTLSDIAEMFGVSVNTIMWSNDLTKASRIQPGQTLVILPVSGISYTVKKGDTIKQIVAVYKADLQEVLQYNDLAIDAVLVAGQTIIIPDAELQTAVPTKIIVKNNPSQNTNNPNYVGYYMRPIRGGVKTQGIHGYNAVDLAAPTGTPIYAAAEGVVILSKSGGYNGGYGSYIIISHPNGTQTVYAHASKNLVAAGEYVKQGQEIALIGMTGKATGPHVHFEIRGAKNPF